MATTPFRPGENEAFEAFYRGHVADVYRYSLSLVRNPVDAEDVTQTTFLNAFQAIEGNKQPRTPRPWLIAIARNICRERHRQSLRRPHPVTLHDAAAAAPSVDLDFRAQEILSGLQGIPSRQRMVLLLYGLEGRSRSEISKELGVAEATVSALLTRARANLGVQLDEGMNCERAQTARRRLLPDGLQPAERKAAHAHLRHCSRCEAAAKAPSWLGLAGTAWLSLHKLIWPVGRVARTGRRGEAAATAGAGTIAAKTVLLATVGTLAGGAAWHVAQGGRPTQPSFPRPVAHSVANAAFQPLLIHASGPRKSTVVVRGTRFAMTGLRSHSSAPSLTQLSMPDRSSSPAEPGFRAEPKAIPVTPQSRVGDGGASLSVTPGAGAPPALSVEPSTALATAATTKIGNHQARPGSASPNSAVGRGNAGRGDGGKGQANAPGQLKTVDGKPGGGQAGAPGQLRNAPGQLRRSDPGAGGTGNALAQQAAPGQNKSADPPGNSGSGLANAPGQQIAPGQDNPGGGQASAPGQQKDPAQGNAADGAQGVPGGGQANAPGQQTDPGQGQSVGGAPGTPGGGEASAPGQQKDPGQGNAAGHANAVP